MAANFLNPPDIAPPSGNGYTHVVETRGAGRTIYLAGQLGLKPSGEIAGDFRAQTVQVFENLKAALAAVGADFGHVVKTTNFLTDIGELAVFREVRDLYLADPKPASTTLSISALARPDALIEIEAIAFLPED